MTPIIKDKFGNVKTWAWLIKEFGQVVIHPANPGPGWRVVEIRESDDIPRGAKFEGAPPWLYRQELWNWTERKVEAPAAILVKVLDADGLPVQGLPVAWYWPDADEDPVCGPGNGQPPGMIPHRCDLPVGQTNVNGDIGHPMGPGAYYDPAEGIGGHGTWMYGAGTNSDLILGLGMIAGTNHRHLDLVYQWGEGEPEPPPPGTGFEDEILEFLSEITSGIKAIIDLMEG